MATHEAHSLPSCRWLLLFEIRACVARKLLKSLMPGLFYIMVCCDCLLVREQSQRPAGIVYWSGCGEAEGPCGGAGRRHRQGRERTGLGIQVGRCSGGAADAAAEAAGRGQSHVQPARGAGRLPAVPQPQRPQTALQPLSLQQVHFPCGLIHKSLASILAILEVILFAFELRGEALAKPFNSD